MLTLRLIVMQAFACMMLYGYVYFKKRIKLNVFYRQATFFGYTDLMVDGAPSPHQSDTTLRWLIDRLRS